MTGRDAVRDQLAAALPHFPWCDEDGAVDDSGFPCVCQPERERLAEYALPVVDRIANERAAAELRAAAQGWWRCSDIDEQVVDRYLLTARADELDPLS